MPTYKGNEGNLLQHWVLAELVEFLREEVRPPGRLCFFDAHAMSPFAVRAANPRPTKSRRVFDFVADGLPAQGSTYEQAWYALRQGPIRYPTSAMFVQYLWHRPLHLVLCEADETTANDIIEWRGSLAPPIVTEIHPDDWRSRFSRGLPSGAAAYLISFDPYMFDRHGPPVRPKMGNMWPRDIVDVANVLGREGEDAPISLQLSTYSANNRNKQQDVISTIEPLFAPAGLNLATVVRADGHMMSMVFTRNIPRVADAGLAPRFTGWIEQVRRMVP